MGQLIKKKFYFLRHGKTDWNDKNLCQGQLDVPLNQAGREEIERLYPLISTLPISKLVTSPLARALETAQIIQKYGSYPIEIIDEIKERGWGVMEGATSAEMYQVEEQEEINVDFVPGADIERRSSFKMRILYGINSALKDGTPLIVSHGRVFLILSEIFEMAPIRQIPNATVIECNPADGEWHLTLHSIKE